MNSNYKILVIQPGKIGDLVVTTSLFNTLFAKFGKFDLVASDFAKDLLSGDERIEKLFQRSIDVSRLKEQRYDAALILMPSYDFFIKCRRAGIKKIWGTTHQLMTKRERLTSLLLHKTFTFDFNTSAEEQYLRMARELGATVQDPKRSLPVTEESRKKVAEYIKENNLADKKLIGMSITAGKSFKEWGDTNYIALVNWLIDKGYTVLGVGGPMDTEKVEVFAAHILRPENFMNCAGTFSLNQTAALADYLDCFIAADTGPLYIADAQGVPVVDIMGPCPSSSQRPRGEQVVIVGECFNDDHPKCYMMNCPSSKAAAYARCMQDISLEEVQQAFEKLHLK